MILLLDTDALVWVLANKESGSPLGPKSRTLLKNATAVYSSPVNILEIRIKTMLGKLESNDELLEDIDAAGIKSLAFNHEHADAILKFPNLAKHDLFDRMLLAKALVENIQFLTSDTTLLALDLTYTLDARK